VASLYGVMRPEGHSERAIYVIDMQGIIRYVHIHPLDEQPDNEVLFGVLESLLTPVERAAARARWEAIERAAIAASPSAQAGQAGQAAALAPTAVAEAVPAQLAVTLYCTPWCPDCRRVRLFFKERQVEFLEIDITRDRAAAQRVRGWTGGYETTPTIDVGGTAVIGFNRPRLSALLNVPE
jgi:glutaredoxin